MFIDTKLGLSRVLGKVNAVNYFCTFTTLFIGKIWILVEYLESTALGFKFNLKW